MLPAAEIKLLNELVADADSLAQMGRVYEGYRFLEFGLHWAESAQQKGCIWAQELLQSYVAALASYTASYGVPRG